MSDDRTVYAKATGIEVVRYDRAGKWYIEVEANYGREGLPAERYHVGIGEAARQALAIQRRGGEILLGLPGGKAFDRKVRGK